MDRMHVERMLACHMVGTLSSCFARQIWDGEMAGHCLRLLRIKLINHTCSHFTQTHAHSDTAAAGLPPTSPLAMFLLMLPFQGRPDRQVSPTVFKPHAWLDESCTVVRLISRLYLPSNAPRVARCITQVLSQMTRHGQSHLHCLSVVCSPTSHASRWTGQGSREMR